jgi:GNAT superfamily N-acetyltransferase
MTTVTTHQAHDRSGLRVRPASIADLSTIIHHRRMMFTDMGFPDRAVLDAMEATCRPFIESGLRDGTYRGWLVENPEGLVVGGGGVLVMLYPSSPRDPSPRRAYILNMYTEPAYRKLGIAKWIMEEMIRWCRDKGFKWVSLHASVHGRHLYETLGFLPTNEMRLAL